MASLVRHLTIDCSDPYRLGRFWAAVLDGSLADDDFPGDPEGNEFCVERSAAERA